MSENLTKQYEGYAVYLPSLQQYYAEYATKTNADVIREKSRKPSKFKTEWLNYLDPNNALWYCAYTLYSAGQFGTKRIPKRDIVGERNPKHTVVVGDSGGFQLGTGSIESNAEKAHLERYKHDAVAQYNNWQHSGFRERTLAWLERNTDYAMTLDMVLWAAETYNEPRAKDSQLRKLSIQQLIDLSVDNLRYFANNRGKASRSTKFLNVLQDIGVVGGVDTGEAWYQAVKDFEFEGWSLGSETGGMFNSLWWLRRLLTEQKLDKSEWVHLLMKSPPVNSVVYTSAQRALRKILGRDNFTISIDTSSPFRMAGVTQSLAVPPKFTSDERSWKISSWKIPQDIRLARNEIAKPFPFASPLSKHLTVNDLMAHDIDDSDTFTDAWANNVITNHNIYTYHRYAIDACDLVFGDKQDFSRVPDKYAEIVGLVEQYFEAENVAAIEERLRILMPVKQKRASVEDNEFKDIENVTFES